MIVNPEKHENRWNDDNYLTFVVHYRISVSQSSINPLDSEFLTNTSTFFFLFSIRSIHVIMVTSLVKQAVGDMFFLHILHSQFNELLHTFSLNAPNEGNFASVK